MYWIILLLLYTQKPMIYVDNDNDKLSLESIDGCIQFSDVTFNYPSRPDVQILNGIDLHIKPGQTMAFVGPSGCGKSTIMSLIPRIYDTTAGSVCVYCRVLLHDCIFI